MTQKIYFEGLCMYVYSNDQMFLLHYGFLEIVYEKYQTTRTTFYLKLNL